VQERSKPGVRPLDDRLWHAFSQLASGSWWLLPLFVLAAVFKSPWFKGFIGEALPFSFDDIPGWPV